MYFSTFRYNAGTDGVVNIRRSYVNFTGQNYFFQNSGTSLKVRHNHDNIIEQRVITVVSILSNIGHIK